MVDLTSEELDEVQRFAAGIGRRFFDQAKGGVMAAWATAPTVTEREELWQRLQAIAGLENLLRDAKPTNEMNRRARERLYATSTRGV